MREIKFRLRDRDNKIVGYEKWYPGAWNEERGEWEAHPRWLYSIDNKYWNPTPIIHCHKDPYIGLEDKTGREIYEGDLIEWDQNQRGEVRWIGINTAFNIKIFPCGWLSFIPPISKVIGNIYENPELVECAKPTFSTSGA